VKLFLSVCLLSIVIQYSSPVHADELDVAAIRHDIESVLDEDYPQLEKLYEDIHAHPEVGFQETRTAALLAAQMRKLGFAVTEKVGGTGIVAIFHNGPGPTILVRTELDGLPMEEKTGLPYASKYKQIVDGKSSYIAHSCGHDVHMAWWVGTAKALLAMKNRWSGTLMFIGQPAEETVSGAKAMIADGLFTRFPKPDYGFAAHVGPGPVGTVVIKDGIVSSASDALEITFKGRGGHGSMPSATIDPITIAAHFVSDVQTIISREKDANAFGVITVGSFHAGSAGNIIPDEADLKLSLRSFTPEVRELLLKGVERTANASASMAGAPPPEIHHLSGTSAVRNDSALAARANLLLKQALGNGVTFVPSSAPGGAPSEDFSQFIDAGVPSVFFAIGGYDAKTIADYKARGVPLPVNHSPYFAPAPKPAIETGVKVLTMAVLMVTAKNAAANSHR